MLGRSHSPLVPPAVRNARVPGLTSVPPRRDDRNSPAPADARIISALEVAALNLGKPQSVKRLAAQLRLSPSHFGHLFKKETGQGFRTFLREVRMTRAENMLQDPTLRVKEIAAAVGYVDVSHFSRDFSRRYGHPPSQSRGPSRQHPFDPSSPRRRLRSGGPR